MWERDQSQRSLNCIIYCYNFLVNSRAARRSHRCRCQNIYTNETLWRSNKLSATGCLGNSETCTGISSIIYLMLNKVSVDIGWGGEKLSRIFLESIMQQIFILAQFYHRSTTFCVAKYIWGVSTASMGLSSAFKTSLSVVDPGITI